MKKQESWPYRRMIRPRASSENIRLKFIQIAGGDAAFGEKLLEMAWQSYCEADRPFGPTEEGMFLWLEHQQQVM
ncbi:MAG: hypothetical protein ACE5G0_03550 [Rhodothermales bacterium]